MGPWLILGAAAFLVLAANTGTPSKGIAINADDFDEIPDDPPGAGLRTATLHQLALVHTKIETTAIADALDLQGFHRAAAAVRKKAASLP